jgi:hypothetical protein
MRWAWLLIVASCHAPTVKAREDDPVDSGTTVTDAADAAESLAPCKGHDEDGDGFPDECDNCPNVPNPRQLADSDLNPLYTNIGTFCYADDELSAANRRVLFEPFTSLTERWKVSGSGLGLFQPIINPPRTTADAVSGGEFQDTASPPVPVAIMRTTVGTTGTEPIVMTMVIERERGGDNDTAQGIFVRGGGTPIRFLACYISGGALRIGVVDEKGCADTQCAFKDLQPPVPMFEPPARALDAYGLRIQVKTFASGSTLLTCRVFDPWEPVSLFSKGTPYASGVELTSTEATVGTEVGVFAYRIRMDVGSIDVLSK